MVENINFDSMLILSIFAFITPIIINSFKKFKIPFVVGEIFIGIIIGKSFLNLVNEDIWIGFLSHLGLAYLLFLSGLEIDFDKLRAGNNKKQLVKRLLMSFGMFGISLVVSFVLSFSLRHFGIINNVSFLAFLFSASAPGLIVPFLKEKNLLNTEYGQTLLIYTLICEFICLLALPIISSTINSGLTYKNFLFIILFIVAFLIFKIIQKFSHILDLSTATFRNLHIGVRAAFALILLLVTLSNKIGAEIILGSFLAGFIFTLILDKGREDLMHELDILGYGFLIPIYFIMVGVNLDISSVFADPKSLLKIPLFLLIIFIIKIVPFLLMSYSFGFNKALSGGLILSAQLSLFIVGAQMAYNLKIISSSDYSTFILTTVISCILFPMLFDKVFKRDNIEEIDIEPTNHISIMEVVPMNENILGKSLKEISFPYRFRVFLIIRDGKEILPAAETQILKGDRLIIAGLANKVDEVLNFLNG
ncbi:sodium:proton antiporter [Clostridium novyi A str. 4570]|uniref:Sodium:proton antiporter n=1 Tax=Clostridium novyi A str. 4570 TaxID=1444290 RepID=A0AA88ZMF0_CLONO|nr:cation:proton antiporter [Clostridium novyi]KGN01153.1 sodium:proton antiporter [Clostridium novyi A str. 4570]